MKFAIPLLAIAATLGVISAAFVSKSNSERSARFALAREELAALRSQVEAQRELIEPMRTQLDLLDFRVNGSFAGSHTNASSLGLEVVMTRLLAELIEQRGVLTRIAGTELGTRLAETPQQVKEILESALELLETRAAEIAEIAEKEHTALDTLDRLRIELRVPDEVASLDPEKAILESKYAPYRAFFEQRRTYAETQRLSQILRMKIAIERMEIPIGRAK